MTRRMCATSLFFCWRERIEKVSALPSHLGIFMYLENGAGITKKFGRCIFVFLLYLLYHLGRDSEWRPPPK